MAGRPRLECSGGNMRAAFLAGERVRTERETKRFCQECRHVPTESVRPAVPSGGSYARELLAEQPRIARCRGWYFL